MEKISTLSPGKLADLSGDEFLALLESATPEELKQISERLLPSVARANILTRLLAVKGELRGIGDIVSWWEWRRPLYNLLVGLCGLPGLLFLLHKGFVFMLIPIGWYAIAANVCYTGGWIAELAARRLFAERARYYGPICLVLGTIFSMALTMICTIGAFIFF